MRHVSRTHRVALDRLFDRINLDTKIQIKNVDTKNQLAEISTKSNFTRDEWSHLLLLFNIVNFSMFFLQPFSFNWKAENHVEESSGKKDRRRTCGGEIKASEFDIKKFKRESISHVGFGYFKQPGELQIALEIWSHKHWEVRPVPRDRGERWISVQVPGNRGVKYRINLQE